MISRPDPDPFLAAPDSCPGSTTELPFALDHPQPSRIPGRVTRYPITSPLSPHGDFGCFYGPFSPPTNSRPVLWARSAPAANPTVAPCLAGHESLLEQLAAAAGRVGAHQAAPGALTPPRELGTILLRPRGSGNGQNNKENAATQMGIEQLATLIAEGVRPSLHLPGRSSKPDAKRRRRDFRHPVPSAVPPRFPRCLDARRGRRVFCWTGSRGQSDEWRLWRHVSHLVPRRRK